MVNWPETVVSVTKRDQLQRSAAPDPPAALSRTVRQALPARPAWVIAKGGITSHDVAVHGLGIRRAEVAGQLFPGVISVFRPIDAAPQAIGVPYIVFAGNVGGDQALAQVVTILNGDQQDP
jgi:uncharacterized protein YgbK (DUF1537 family)